MYKSTKSKSANYIDLKVNGRLFPSWILANFKKYKLPEIITSVEDPCNPKKNDKIKEPVKQELRIYQQFVAKFLDYNSPYRDILLYHGLGSGKTATAINVYNALYTYTPGWNVFILLKASLKATWYDEINTWLNKDDYEYRFRNIIFLNYDAPNADKAFLDAVKQVDSSKKSMYIIEECHNFIRNVYSNVTSNKGKRAQVIYDYIIQDKLDNPDTRVILMSGTPAVNRPFEFALLFNLLKPGIFTKKENEFNQQFVMTAGYERINTTAINLFQRRILGLVSYYLGSTPDLFASKIIHYVDVVMSEYQEDIYNKYEEIEMRMAAKSTTNQVYKSYTRQASNFVFPYISQYINGDNRPRPNKFRISKRDAAKLQEGRDILKDSKNEEDDKVLNVTKYKEAMLSYINGFTDYLNSSASKDKQSGHTIMDDVKLYKEKYEFKFNDFHEQVKKKSNLYTAMHTCSAKMLNIIFNIYCSPGPTLVYSNYVMMEGLEIFKIYLSHFGYYNWLEERKTIPGKIGYCEFHGAIDMAVRKEGMNKFNEDENLRGEFIKIMLVSKAGAEGLSLFNVRQVHIMEPYWNEVIITQMIGRGIRLCSHKLLPMDERQVDVFRYKSVKKNPLTVTTDKYIEDLARTKDGVIQSFLSAVKEAAIDCVLNKNVNMSVEQYRCFQFDEKALFEKNIGPAYKQDIYDDIRMDNGSNSLNSITMKIKVMAIKAVTLLTDPSDTTVEPKYSKSNNYWYYEKSGVVYDKDLHYPVGRIGYNDEGLPLKYDKDTYVITYTIPIPMIDE